MVDCLFGLSIKFDMLSAIFRLEDIEVLLRGPFRSQGFQGCQEGRSKLPFQLFVPFERVIVVDVRRRCVSERTAACGASARDLLAR